MDAWLVDWTDRRLGRLQEERGVALPRVLAELARAVLATFAVLVAAELASGRFAHALASSFFSLTVLRVAAHLRDYVADLERFELPSVQERYRSLALAARCDFFVVRVVSVALSPVVLWIAVQPSSPGNVAFALFIAAHLVFEYARCAFPRMPSRRAAARGLLPHGASA